MKFQDQIIYDSKIFDYICKLCSALTTNTCHEVTAFELARIV